MTTSHRADGTIVVRDCLGRERRPVHIYSDGSFNCPFCSYPVIGKPGCSNPACFARVDPPYPVEEAKRRIALDELRKKEERKRAADAAWSEKWREEDRKEREAERARRIAEAEKRGVCVWCMIAGGDYRPPKFIKHRGPCPRER